MDNFPFKPEAFLTTIARLFAAQKATREVELLSSAIAEITCVDYDNWDGGTYSYQINLCVPVSRFGSLQEEDREEIASRVYALTETLLKPHHQHKIGNVVISPVVETDPEWRDKAQAWIARHDVNNQGRVRSDNIAALECDGLRFRSQQEINLYKALKASGVSFLPLPVVIRGGDDYRRIEPDFLVFKDGILLVVEIDGDMTHHETPVEAHSRTTILVHEGAHLERVKASECANRELAQKCTARLLNIIVKLKNSR